MPKVENVPVDPVPDSPVLTRKQAAAYLRISTTSLWRLRDDGLLAAVRLNGKILFRRQDLDALIDRNLVSETG